MEALGFLYGLQLIVLLVAAAVSAVLLFTHRKAVRTAAVVALLACFIASFAIAGVHFTFLHFTPLAAAGPLLVALVFAFSLWRMRANNGSEQSET